MQLFTTREYMAIDIASNFGLDKKTWDERLEWFQAHEGNLLNMVGQAKEPALYFAGVVALDELDSGKKSGYPISLDATASGKQILAVLTGDRSAAQLCNVVNFCDEHGKPIRRDSYVEIYKIMVEKAGDTAKVDRDDVKKAVMTALYGSKAMPKQVFGEGNLLQIFYETMSEAAPAAWELNEAFIAMWRPDVLVNSWVLPDNFHVQVKVIGRESETVHFLNQPFETHRAVNMCQEEGRSLGANTIHSIDGMIVREMTRRCMYDIEKVETARAILNDQEFLYNGVDLDESDSMVNALWSNYQRSGYLSARILDHLSSDNLTEDMKGPIGELLASLPAKPFQVIAVHDCFRCLPGYGNDLRKQYNRQLYEIARSNLLSFLLSQIIGREVSVGKLDDTLHQDILRTEYALS